MCGKILGDRQLQACFAQLLPACPDIAEVFARSQAGGQLSFHCIKCGGGFLFLCRVPVPHGLVAAEQRGRNAAVQLDGLNGMGDRLDQCNAFQLSL